MAIQLVELSAFRSLPILAYCNASRVSLVLTDPKRKKESKVKLDTIHQNGSNPI